MNSSADVLPDIRVRDVRFDGESLIVDLMDGRTISAPLAWYPRLLAASPEQRQDWEIESVSNLFIYFSPSGDFSNQPVSDALLDCVVIVRHMVYNVNRKRCYFTSNGQQCS